MADSKDIKDNQNISKGEIKPGLSRKDFLYSMAGLFALAGGFNRNGFTKFASAKSLTGTRMAILYDSSKCIGCRLCEAACEKKNNPFQENIQRELSKTKWTVIQETPYGNKPDLFLKRQCMHCTDASCAAVCPTGAAKHNGEYVVIDQDICIGCGYCEQSCPFGVPHTSPPKGAAAKCDFCFDLVSSGSKPACVEACPIGALKFGARSDLLSTAQSWTRELVKMGWPEAQIYGENELGGLGVIYILYKPPAFYRLPEKPRLATKNVLVHWASGSIAAGLIILPFWYFYKHRS